MALGSENPGACLKQQSSPDDSSTTTTTIDDIAADAEFNRRRGCCFCTPSRFFFTSSSAPTTTTSSSSSSSPPGSGGHCWQRIGGRNDDEFVAVRAWKKMREWSEIVAGPKWKNFIRRMGRSAANRQKKFGYDPLSYAMNFDEGRSSSPSEEVDIGFRNFSSRYASMPISAKSSMDLGKDGGGPSFL